MVGSSKKRRAARSPSRSGSTKKARQASTTASLHSQQDSGPQLSRAKSVFRGQRDPYFPHNRNGNTALPTGDDYLFRIQVISTTTDLNTDVFKKAVQGLVKICFPQDVLEEIGIEVVTQHMRSEDAPEENITMMKDIFRSEMIHRVTWMLAEYLDRPAKVEASVKAVMAASASLHGAKIGEDVLGDVTLSLEALQEKFPDKSTERLANSTDMETLSFHVVECDTTDEQSDGAEHDRRVTESPERSPRSDHQPTLHTKKHRKKEATIEPKEPVKRTREGKEGKVSTSWRWNVQDVSSIADVSEHFKRTSDLFAYHALPILKQRFGAEVKRKELRQAIEAMLTSMPAEEFEKWAESFDKLALGDYSMLDRILPEPSTAANRIVSEAPAPVNAHVSAPKLPMGPNNNTQQQAAIANVTRSLGSMRAVPKQEMDVEDEMELHTPVAERLQSEGGLTAPAAPHLSTVRHASIVASETPIIDLLWGPSALDAPRKMVVQTIMENLDKRVPLKSITLPRIDGEITIQSKANLRGALLSFKQTNASRSYPSDTRSRMEVKLIPWVVGSLNSFPELKALSSVFVSIMPDCTDILDLIYDFSMPSHIENAREIRDLLLANLTRRGIVGGLEDPVHRAIGIEFLLILTKADSIDLVKRGGLEIVLRHIAFSHKDKFRDLKNTSLVQAWELNTGLTWRVGKEICKNMTRAQIIRTCWTQHMQGI